jgi:tetratricopeptide (TPR) repeat protein
VICDVRRHRQSHTSHRIINDQQLNEIFGPVYAPLIKHWHQTVQSPNWEQKQVFTLLEGYPTDTSSPTFSQADDLNSEGWMCHEQRRYRDALGYYERALAHCREFPMVWNNKGLAHFRLGEFEPARAAYLEAIRIRPGFVKPWSNMGIIYRELQHDREEAITWFRRALALDPEYHRARQYLDKLESESRHDS